MTSYVFNRRQSRLVDERAIADYGLSGLVLMENAGRGAVDILLQVGLPGPVAICCGRGNNGGDGFVMARHLDNRGIAVRVLLAVDPARFSGDAATNFGIVRRLGLFVERPDPADLAHCFAGAGCVVDALLGTGATGEPRPPLDAWIDVVNRQPAPIVAVDLPSGLDCDSGAAATHTVRAAHTVTFVAAKPGLLVPQAAEYVGRLHVVDLGVPRRLLDEIAAI